MRKPILVQSTRKDGHEAAHHKHADLIHVNDSD
jgi:hypothetical protein